MPLIAVGISHHTAPLEVRERLAIARADYAGKVRELRAMPGIREAILVSTCNRTEVYAAAAAKRVEDVTRWMAAEGGFDEALASGYFYAHLGPEAVRHLFRVACGLESLALGEPQIIGQLKEAWSAAKEGGGAGKLTDRLFQRAFATSKAVRHTTGINDHPVSVAYIASVLAQQIFGDLSTKTVLMIGAGEMIELCGRHFHAQGVQNLFIANRSAERANRLAQELHARALPLNQLDDHLPDADIVIASTSSRRPIIGLDNVRRAIRARRHRPAFMVDLGVPRDIDPGVGDLNDIYLYTIDDLQQVADDNLNERHRAAEEAGGTIDAAVAEFMRWVHGVRAADSLKKLRALAEERGEQLAERALHRIESGADPAGAIRQLASTLVHHILHGPSERLRAAAEQQHYEMLEAADWLFDAWEDPDEENAADDS